MGRLENKVAVITGGASGMGLATATRFAAEGAAVVIGDLNADGGETAIRQLKQKGGRACFQKCDVEAPADIKALVDRAASEYGKLDIIYNNAGLGGATGPIEEITVEGWDRTLAILLRAVWLGMKYAVPEMRKAGGGSIISTASVAGLMAGQGPHAYSVAKAGVVHLTRAAALELGKDRIRVNCICPGAINTPLFYSGVPGGKETMDAVLTGLQPIQRAGMGEDIANAALFLASDESEWVTGLAMVVDGGLISGKPLFGSAPGQIPVRQPQPGGTWSGPSFERR